MSKQDEQILNHLRLQLNIQHPDLEGVWADGYACAQAQESLDDNPFGKNSVEFAHWSEGWWAGAYDTSSVTVTDDVKSNQAENLLSLRQKMRLVFEISVTVISAIMLYEWIEFAF